MTRACPTGAEGARLLGPDGLLSQVTRAVLERVLAEGMTGRPGYGKHDPLGAWRVPYCQDVAGGSG